MSDFRKVVTEKVLEIKNAISNENESELVMGKIAEIIDAFSEQVLEVSRRQIKLEERTEEVFEVLSNIEEELVQGMADDFTAECPYCGEDVMDEIPEDGSDFECPKCHNMIELEMMFDGCGGDCDCCHSDCDCDDDCDCGCECDDDCDCGCDCNCGDDCDCDDDCDCGCKD